MSALTLTLTGWGSRLGGLTTVVKTRTKRPQGLDLYLQGEFRAYGLGLARAQTSREASRGIVNPQRDQAAKAYLAALEDVAAAYSLPTDGGLYGGLSSIIPDGPHTRAELIEFAEREADAALLMLCAA